MNTETLQDTAIQDTAMPIGAEQLLELTAILEKYKAGKAHTEKRIIASENWWKLRNTAEENRNTAPGSFTSVSGWLHNVIVSKHADSVEAYPEPVILPREENDRRQARLLSRIVPCIMEQNKFEQTYSDAMWQKLKTGTGVYKVIWDSTKLNGLGDIAIERVNLLNLYWEPGVTDIQKSRRIFHTELVDREVLRQQYPQLQDKSCTQSFLSAKFMGDETPDNAEKATVIECYYHKDVEGRQSVQYVKYVGDTVLFATENQPELASRGLYDHGRYPYVFDTLFPIEGSPCGYGYVDICRNPQTEIDLLKTSFVKNAMVGSAPRFFARQDGGVNEAEFLDTSKPLVHVNGNLGEDSLRQIKFSPLESVYVNVLDRTINELRETSGNTETATGNISAGVTAASAIAALQEASGKGSRDANAASYRAFGCVVDMVIELIRQFYELPRQFRITGEMGEEKFVSFDNAALQKQHQGMDFGQDMGFRLPVFDIKVSAQKRSAYTRVTQNELAMQFFKLGFFEPERSQQALMCLNMMDFEEKDELLQRISQNAAQQRMLSQLMQQSAAMAAAGKSASPLPNPAAPKAPAASPQAPAAPVQSGAPLSQSRAALPAQAQMEGVKMQNARAQAQEAGR